MRRLVQRLPNHQPNTENTMYIIRGMINGAMCYVCGGRDNKDYTVRPSSVGIHAVTLFEQEQDAKNALDEIKHGTAKLLVVTGVEESRNTLLQVLRPSVEA